jgi:hypothetical protein
MIEFDGNGRAKFGVPQHITDVWCQFRAALAAVAIPFTGQQQFGVSCNYALDIPQLRNFADDFIRRKKGDDPRSISYDYQQAESRKLILRVWLA